MPELHPQEWLLIAQALVDHAGPDINTPRDGHCWQLADRIAYEHDLKLTEAVRQTDRRWFEEHNDARQNHLDP
jgi:hypothetical protein